MTFDLFAQALAALPAGARREHGEQLLATWRARFDEATQRLRAEHEAAQRSGEGLSDEACAEWTERSDNMNRDWEREAAEFLAEGA